MARCAYIKPGGEGCGATAMRGYDTCYGHRPDLGEVRRRSASRGGKAGGRGRPGTDLADLKREVRKVIDGVLAGTVPQGAGAVALQGYNTLLRASKVELDIREQTELIERLEALERVAGAEEGGRRRGA